MILASHGIIGSQITQFVGLLDTYTGAAAAYSLRKLRSAYTGDAIRVRRASDNTEQDIGFVNNVLDTSTLTSFCSGTNGFVKTWYDQSGNGYDATQTTAANQPQIVSSGSVIVDNGSPCISCSTSSILTNSSFIPTSSIGLSCFNVYSTSLAAAANADSLILYSFGGSSNNYLQKGPPTGFLSGEYITFYRVFGGLNGRLGSTLYRRDLNTSVVESEFYLSSGFTLFQNSQIQTMDLVSGGATTSSNWSPSAFGFTGGLYLNSTTNNSSSQNCKIQEMIFYDNDQSSNRTGISTNINDFYSIY